jgi:hypothetical protein
MGWCGAEGGAGWSEVRWVTYVGWVTYGGMRWGGVGWGGVGWGGVGWGGGWGGTRVLVQVLGAQTREEGGACTAMHNTQSHHLKPSAQNGVRTHTHLLENGVGGVHTAAPGMR